LISDGDSGLAERDDIFHLEQMEVEFIFTALEKEVDAMGIAHDNARLQLLGLQQIRKMSPIMI